MWWISFWHTTKFYLIQTTLADSFYFQIWNKTTSEFRAAMLNTIYLNYWSLKSSEFSHAEQRESWLTGCYMPSSSLLWNKTPWRSSWLLYSGRIEKNLFFALTFFVCLSSINWCMQWLLFPLKYRVESYISPGFLEQQLSGWTVCKCRVLDLTLNQA